jgi:hypothetical protein
MYPILFENSWSWALRKCKKSWDVLGLFPFLVSSVVIKNFRGCKW